METHVVTNGTASPQDYLDAGLSIVPIKADGSKAAAIPTWKPYQSRLATSDEVGRWFLPSNIGIAIIYGSVSGNAECLDVDNHELWEHFRREVESVCPGLLDRLTIIQTPRPGYHLIYRCETIEGNQKLAVDANGETLIETRGERGYALAPGSHPDCHETGRTYEHISGPPLTNLPTITPAERQALFQAARIFDQSPQGESFKTFNQASRNSQSPGDKFNVSASWDDILIPHGWTKQHASGELTHWCRPGKSAGTSATTGCRSTSGNELLCVFSTNAHPFEGPASGKICSTHSKFDAYARLNYGSEYSAAAKALIKEGLGERSPHNEFVEDSAHQPEQQQKRRPIKIWTLNELAEEYPHESEPIVDGLFRLGDTINMISATKVGKSWGLYGLAVSIAMGWDWLGRFPVKQGRVLIVDNELKRGTIWRRIVKVAAVMGGIRGVECSIAELQDRIHIVSLRGDLRTLDEIGEMLDTLGRDAYQLVAYDAKYRFLPAGVSENDNSAETQTYNLLDRFGDKMNAGQLLVHHSSKGSQSEKRVTDVGAGAGSQSRAADCHIVLREHEKERSFVFDAAIRTFEPIEPFVCRWDFPIWVPDEDADPAKLKRKIGAQAADTDAADKAAMPEILGFIRKNGPQTVNAIASLIGGRAERASRILCKLRRDEKVVADPCLYNKKETLRFRVPEQDPHRDTIT